MQPMPSHISSPQSRRGLTTVAAVPQLLSLWHPTKNVSHAPENVSHGSKKEHWWRCPKDPSHEWQAPPNRIFSTPGSGCPFCKGMRAHRTNSLAKKAPRYAAMWHPTKNGHLTPNHVVALSGKKFWFKCPKGPDHDFQATPANLVTGGRSGCPYCHSRKVSVTNSLATRSPEIAKLWDHSENGGLTPRQVTCLSGKKHWWTCPKGPDHRWQATSHSLVRNVAHAAFKGFPLNKGTPGCPFCAGARLSVTNSLAALAPRAAALWHPTKNRELTPSQVTRGSTVLRWWKCPRGPDHEWLASPARLTAPQTKHGCPFCAGLRPSVTNSIRAFSKRGILLWHPTRNGDATPDTVVAWSGKKYWWLCPDYPDHEWQATPANVLGNETGCPFCTGKRVSATNSLAARSPLYAAMWHPTKNGALTPCDITSRSGKKVWWKCPKGSDHEWQAAPATLITNGTYGCPYCAGMQVSFTNSLATNAPQYAAMWHPTKNGTLTPNDVVAFSQKKYWWKCPKGLDHEWQTTPATLLSNGAYGCPFCARQKASVTNSLASLFPDKAAFWHPTKNGALTPADILPFSNKRYWWQCCKGVDHEWQERAFDLVNRTNYDCPVCRSLAFRFPDIAAEWSARNARLTPRGVPAFSGRKVWWCCRFNPRHEWSSSVSARTFIGTGCPYCSLLPRSRIEIYFAFELAYFLGIDPCLQNIRIPTDHIHVDVVIPRWRTALELDGYYWHKSKLEKDSAKIRQLERHGWRLRRIREKPLDKVGPNDIVVDPFPNVSAVPSLIVQVLRALQPGHNLTVEGLDSYAKRNVLQNRLAADDYIHRRLSRKSGLPTSSDHLPLEDPVPF